MTLNPIITKTKLIRFAGFALFIVFYQSYALDEMNLGRLFLSFIWCTLLLAYAELRDILREIKQPSILDTK
ncbi:MAG: hypothetical protein COB09_18910 [Thalassobium sp.]|nr:MAG: hypothetical protein COB09_18910 [Thalassobium sp.]